MTGATAEARACTAWLFSEAQTAAEERGVEQVELSAMKLFAPLLTGTRGESRERTPGGPTSSLRIFNNLSMTGVGSPLDPLLFSLTTS